MSIFDFIKKNTSNKKREAYCADARIFIQVHYVREHKSDKYSFNTLKLKTDSERDECNQWYISHGNPDNFMDIVRLYINEKKIKITTVCSQYGLDSKIFGNSTFQKCPVEKWEAVAICFGLDLNISEARALLKTAGYALTNSSNTDLIIRYCLENNIHDLEDINYILKKICDHTLNQIR